MLELAGPECPATQQDGQQALLIVAVCELAFVLGSCGRVDRGSGFMGSVIVIQRRRLARQFPDFAFVFMGRYVGSRRGD